MKRRDFLIRSSAFPLLPLIGTWTDPLEGYSNPLKSLKDVQQNVRGLSASVVTTILEAGPAGKTEADEEFGEGPGTILISPHGYCLTSDRAKGRLRIVELGLNAQYAKYILDAQTDRSLRLETLCGVPERKSRAALLNAIVPALPDGGVAVAGGSADEVVLGFERRFIALRRSDGRPARSWCVDRNGRVRQEREYFRYHDQWPIPVQIVDRYYGSDGQLQKSTNTAISDLLIDDSATDDAIADAMRAVFALGGTSCRTSN